MVNSDSTIIDLSNLIGKLHKDRDDAVKKLTELDEQVKAIEHHIEAVETTLRLIRHNGHPTESDVYDSLVESLKRKRLKRPKKKRITLKNALVEIANIIGLNGTFKAKEAKRIMLSAGLIANPKNADSIVYALLDRYGDFEKVEPGIYRLTGRVQPRLLTNHQ